MSALRPVRPWIASGTAIIGFVWLAACVRREPQPPPGPVESEPPSAQAPRTAQRPPSATPLSSPTQVEATEPYIDLTMVNAPVRLILQRLAQLGNLDLIVPANLNRTLSVEYLHVPVSVALNDVLKRSGLRLGTSTLGPLPYDTVTVFYRLPANIDSLSADAIMHRFGVSRAMAELIVRSRRPQ